MKNKLSKLLKITIWKRWFFVAFFVISSVLFIGLSFGLKTKDGKLNSDYKNSVSLTIKPTYNDGSDINDEAYSKQLLFNLHNQLKNSFENSIVTSSYEKENVWNINISNITSNEQYQDVISIVRDKKPLTILPINASSDSNFYQSTLDNNFIFNNAVKTSSSYSLKMNESYSNGFYKWVKDQRLGDKVIIWKNFDILKEIVKQAIDSEGYNGTFYEFLFFNGLTPENNSQNNNNSTLKKYFFKDELEYNGKKYKPQDFIVSKNEVNDFNNTVSLNINKNFEVNNYSPSASDYDKEFFNVSYWVSTYKLNNYSLSPLSPANGTNSYLFLIISLASIYLIISIFVVINYGYLGIFSIFILAIIISLALLMMTVFFGDYNSISIILIIMTTFISLDFIVGFLDKIKKEFLKEKSVSKSIESTIKKTQKSTYLKAILLTLLIGTFYVVTATVVQQFSVILLIVNLAILIIQIPLMFLMSKNLVNLKIFEQNKKLIGFWKDKNEEMSVSLKSSENVSNNDEELEKIEEQISNATSGFENKKSYVLYRNYFDKKSKYFLIIFPIFVIATLITFLVKLFIGSFSFTNALNLSSQDQQQIVLRVYKENNQEFTNTEIEQVKNEISSRNLYPIKMNVQGNKEIELFFKSDTSRISINELNNQLINLYNLKIIPSSLINSNTFKVMEYTFYGILVAIIAMSIFVLLWMNWTKALALIIVFAINLVSLILMVGTGILQLGSLLSIAMLFSFISLLVFSINILIKVFNKLKHVRIEEMTSENIKNFIYNQTYQVMKPFVIMNLMIVTTMTIFAIFVGSLSISFIVFMLLSVSINFVSLAFFLPKLLYVLEAKKAKIKRKIILNNFWDTEKIKEQNFKGINDIK